MTSTHFSALSLHPRILSGVEALGYKTLTPIQEKSIPPILEGHDVMGLAQTGTGKTAAFVLPILQRLMQGPRGQVRALILAPTRELAQQIHDDIKNLGRDSGLRSTTLYGGVSYNPQFNQLRRGVEIVVACPGRLLDHMNQRSINLHNLEVLVLDEADQMFDMGFLPNIRRILQQLPHKRQSLLFSATMPREVRQLAEDILTKPVTVQIGHSAPANTVKQAVYPVAEHLKTQLLIKILQTYETGSVLIFTRTKHRAKSVAEQLENVGYPTASMQGNLSQAKRQKALNDFRDGKMPILVATDIAARGIDVAKISHVINYDMPATVEAYTHRIGRTGRANHIGDAFTLVTPGDMHRVRSIERVLNAKLEQRTLEDFDYKMKTPRHANNESHTREREFSDRRPSRPQQRYSQQRHSERHSEQRHKDRDFAHDKPRKAEGRHDQEKKRDNTRDKNRSRFSRDRKKDFSHRPERDRSRSFGDRSERSEKRSDNRERSSSRFSHAKSDTRSSSKGDYSQRRDRPQRSDERTHSRTAPARSGSRFSTERSGARRRSERDGSQSLGERSFSRPKKGSGFSQERTRSHADDKNRSRSFGKSDSRHAPKKDGQRFAKKNKGRRFRD